MNPAFAWATLSSAVFGTADFLGGFAARRISALTVTFAASAAGLVTLSVAMIVLHGTPRLADLVVGAGAGLCGGVGVALLYRALAIGPVSIAAPVIALVGLAMPVLFGILALGERPSLLAVVGIAMAIGAIPLLSSADAVPTAGGGMSSHRRVLTIALLSGVCVGGFLVLIGRLPLAAGLAPLFVARLTTVALFAGILLVRRQPLWPAGAARPTLGSGLLDAFANIAFFIAVNRGSLAIVGTIVSLAPATTVLFARLVLHERWNMAQRGGLALAAVAIVCVSLG